jgi:hypothetical protein
MTRLWFRARDYGWGWAPVTLEGWLVVVAFLMAVGAVTVVFIYQLHHGGDPRATTLRYLVALAILIGLLIAICWLTGERPRWRWGG